MNNLVRASQSKKTQRKKTVERKDEDDPFALVINHEHNKKVGEQNFDSSNTDGSSISDNSSSSSENSSSSSENSSSSSDDSNGYDSSNA